MTQFEYVSTFVSILYAVMVGRAVATLSGLSSKNVDWRHVAWIAILLVNILQTWWKRWGGHDSEYHYGIFLLSVAHAIPLMFAVATLSPSKSPASWSDYLDETRLRFFMAYAAFWVTIGISNYIGGSNWTGTLIPVLMSAVGAYAGSRVAQIVVQVFFAIMFVVSGVVMTLAGR